MGDSNGGEVGRAQREVHAVAVPSRYRGTICSSNYAQECDRRVENEGGLSYYGSSERCLIAYDADNFDTDDQGYGRFLYAHQMDTKYKSYPGYGNSFTEDKLWTGNLPLGSSYYGPLGSPPTDYERSRLGEDKILRMGEDHAAGV